MAAAAAVAAGEGHEPYAAQNHFAVHECSRARGGVVAGGARVAGIAHAAGAGDCAAGCGSAAALVGGHVRSRGVASVRRRAACWPPTTRPRSPSRAAPAAASFVARGWHVPGDRMFASQLSARVGACKLRTRRGDWYILNPLPTVLRFHTTNSVHWVCLSLEGGRVSGVPEFSAVARLA